MTPREIEAFVETHIVPCFPNARHNGHWAEDRCPNPDHKSGQERKASFGFNVKTGAFREAQIFVAVLGASNYTYAEATWSQLTPDWVGAHVRAFEFFGGVPQIVIPDQLKSAVSRACRYDPDLNRTYHQMIRYYGAAAIPARPRKPKDKAKAENAVLVVERWILARLRHHAFFTLSELNRTIRSLLRELCVRRAACVHSNSTRETSRPGNPV